MKDSPFWTNLTAAAGQPAAAPLSAPYPESIVIIIMIIFNRNINHWTCDHVVIMWFTVVKINSSILVSHIVYKTYFWANFGQKRALASLPGDCPSWATRKRCLFGVSSWWYRKNWRICTKKWFWAENSTFGPKRATLGNRGRETARRAAKQQPTGKPKLFRVTSGYGELMIPLSRVRLSQKNGGYMGVA